jgi:hypothetical protein
LHRILRAFEMSSRGEREAVEGRTASSIHRFDFIQG